MTRPRRLDRIGLAPFAVMMCCLTWVLSRGSRWDWFEDSRIVWLSLAATAGFVLFVLGQLRAERARRLFDLGVFRSTDFSFAFLVSFVAGAALFGSGYLIPAFAVSVLGLAPVDAGLLLLPGSASFAAALLLAAYFMQARALTPIATAPLGIGLIMAAMWMLSASNGESGSGDMMPAVVLRGLGLGFLFLSITLIAFARLPQAQLAVGIGLFNIGRQLGGLLGVASLQTMIEHGIRVNQTVLGASVAAGAPGVADRLASTSELLTIRGVDPGPAGQMALALLAKTVSGQAETIAYDSAFKAVALLFVAAAPVVLAARVALLRLAAHRRKQEARP